MVYWNVWGTTPVMEKELYAAQQQDKHGHTIIPPTHQILVEKLRRERGISVQEVHPGWLFGAVGNDRVEQRYVESGTLKRNLMHPARVNDMSVAQSCLYTACADKLARS